MVKWAGALNVVQFEALERNAVKNWKLISFSGCGTVKLVTMSGIVIIYWGNVNRLTDKQKERVPACADNS